MEIRKITEGIEEYPGEYSADGVYDKDPMTNPEAILFDHLTYMEAINRRVEVMDSTALSLCIDNHLPILVLNLWHPDAMQLALYGEHVGTLIAD